MTTSNNAANRAGEAGALWGGRFASGPSPELQKLSKSTHFDWALADYDITGSQAHAKALHAAGYLTTDELKVMTDSLEKLRAAVASGEFVALESDEDVHSALERGLIDIAGVEVGGKLRAGRSRNDQVATDIRLYVRDEIDAIRAELKRLLTGLIDLAEREADTIMPGFTHLQTAQPVTFGHHLLAWFENLKRDDERLVDLRQRVNRLPLGAAALAGTTYPIDRHYTAELLGFDAVCENSLDAVSDRDFAIEFSAAAALIMMHLSRFSEELVLWASAQFQFVDLPDRFCTGSSIMPQKKNPDVPELVRGKAGRVFGHLMALLTLMKGQPLAYNKDNQEDKEPLFDAIDTVRGSLRAFADMVPALQPRRDIMREAARRGFATATDLADYLVKRGVAFRDAHEVVGKAVGYGVQTGKDLAEMSLVELQQFSPIIADDVFAVLTLEGSVSARNHFGGTAPAQVRAAVQRARARLI